MKTALAGDSAGIGLAKLLAEYLRDRYQVSEVSVPADGSQEFYANLSDRVGQGVINGT